MNYYFLIRLKHNTVAKKFAHPPPIHFTGEKKKWFLYFKPKMTAVKYCGQFFLSIMYND